MWSVPGHTRRVTMEEETGFAQGLCVSAVEFSFTVVSLIIK